MQWNTKQMREDALIKEGQYKFSVLHTKEKRSQTGNDMLNLKLALEVNGRIVVFFTSIVLTPKMFWLFEHFCKTTGMPEKIESGNLMAQECDNKEGVILIGIRPNKETGELENFTKDFVKPLEFSQAPVVSPQVDSSLNDDIPSFTN